MVLAERGPVAPTPVLRGPSLRVGPSPVRKQDGVGTRLRRPVSGPPLRARLPPVVPEFAVLLVITLCRETL